MKIYFDKWTVGKQQKEIAHQFADAVNDVVKYSDNLVLLKKRLLARLMSLNVICKKMKVK